MSKLEELIAELCPDGVEFKTIGQLSKFRRGSFPQPYGNAEWYDGEGAMPFVQVADIGDDMSLADDTKRKISVIAQPKSVFAAKGSIVISLQGSIGRIAITQYDAYIDRTVAIFSNLSDKLLSKYFVYQLQRIFAIKEKTARGSTIKTITKEEFTEFSIPMPSLPVQNRIVRILDTFTELTAELTARKKQYGYYSNQVFLKAGENSSWKSVGDVIMSLKTGLNPRQNFKLNVGGSLPYITGKDIFGNRINVTERTDKITEDALCLINKRAQLEKGVVLFASTGTGTVGRMAVIEDYQNDWGISETLYAMKMKSDMINPLYLMYAV